MEAESETFVYVNILACGNAASSQLESVTVLNHSSSFLFYLKNI